MPVMEMKRREFLVRSITGVSSVLLGSRFSAAQQRPAMFDPYELVPLGKTKIKVSRVGLGTGTRGGRRSSNHTRMGKERFEALVNACYERGIRLFDAADLYGTHPFLAEALKKIPRKNYVLVSKIWFHRFGLPETEKPDADVVVERFLKELNTDYIDLILLHCVISPKWREETSDQMNSLEKLKKKGLVRAHGISCHSLQALQVCVDEPWVDSVHARINAYGVNMDGSPDEVAPILQKLHQAGKAVVGMKLIGEGQFRDSDEKRDKSIQYVLNLGCVDTMVVGFEKIEEVDDFAARVCKVPVTNKQSQAHNYRPVLNELHQAARTA
jgi:predicted aldo/keto reductase-like oxidoreductase